MDRTKIISFAVFLWFCCIAAGSVHFLYPKWQENNNVRKEKQSVDEQVARSAEKIVEMNIKINDMKTSPKAVARVARDKFFMCRPGETIYRFVDENDHPYKDGDYIID